MIEIKLLSLKKVGQSARMDGIRYVRQETSLGIREAKDVVDNLPVTVYVFKKSGISLLREHFVLRVKKPYSMFLMLFGSVVLVIAITLISLWG